MRGTRGVLDLLVMFGVALVLFNPESLESIKARLRPAVWIVGTFLAIVAFGFLGLTGISN